MKKIILVLMLCLGQSLFADAVWCSGTITQLANHKPGGLFIKLSSTNIIKICSFDAQTFNQSPESCKHLASLAAQAYAQNENVTILVDNVPGTACMDMPNWFGADLRFFSIKK